MFCRQMWTTDDIPEDRVKPGEPPFSISVVDCSRPFMVEYGRAKIKCYGCIFICFSVRAVHIEMIHSLDTSSFNVYFEKRQA